MRKRTRIAVGIAALLLAAVVTSVTGPGQAANASPATSGFTLGQRTSGILRSMAIGRPPVDPRAEANVFRHLGDVVRSSKRPWEVAEIGCKVKDLVMLENPLPRTPQYRTDQFGNTIQVSPLWLQKEINARVERMAGWQNGGAGLRASVNSLLKEMDEAKDLGDGGMLGVDLFCLGNGVMRDG
jgi:hypothetical protein